jgi:hypothetical protein
MASNPPCHGLRAALRWQFLYSVSSPSDQLQYQALTPSSGSKASNKTHFSTSFTQERSFDVSLKNFNQALYQEEVLSSLAGSILTPSDIWTSPAPPVDSFSLFTSEAECTAAVSRAEEDKWSGLAFGEDGALAAADDSSVVDAG